MKTLLLILVFSITALGQPEPPPLPPPPPPVSIYKGPVSTNNKSLKNVYTNDTYNFSFELPDSLKANEKLNKEFGGIASFTCDLDCSSPGIFVVYKIIKINFSVAEMVRGLQSKTLQEQVAKQIIDEFGVEANPTILSKQYVAYKGRPAIKIDFNYVKDNVSFTGGFVEIFLDERKILMSLAYITTDSNFDGWRKTGDAIVRSLYLNSQKSVQIIPPRRPNVLTVQGDTNLDARDYVGPVPETVSGGVLNGKATSLPQPVYPPATLAVRASGTVTVQVKIDESGNVIAATAVSGHPLLKAAAEAAARKATFSATRLQGVPVQIVGIITYNFIL